MQKQDGVQNEPVARRIAPRSIKLGFWKAATQWFIAVVVVLGFFYVYPLIFGTKRGPIYAWDFSLLQPYARAIGRGLWLTIQLTFFSLIFSVVLGVFVAAARRSNFVPLRIITASYIEIMRSTPLLIQLVWIFYALPILTGITFPSYEAAILALTIHMAAYYGEAFRAGIQSIPKEYLEAADVIGLNAWDKARFVVLPQAVRNVMPVLVTLTLLLVKDTSLVSVLGINDLMNVGSSIALSTFKPLEVFTAVGIIYLVIGLPLTSMVRKLEIKMAKRIV